MSVTGSLLSKSEEQTKKRADELEDRLARLEIIVEHIASMLTSEPSLDLDYLVMLHRLVMQDRGKR